MSAAWLDGVVLWGLLPDMPHGTERKSTPGPCIEGASWTLDPPHGRKRAGCLARHPMHRCSRSADCCCWSLPRIEMCCWVGCGPGAGSVRRLPEGSVAAYLLVIAEDRRAA